MKESAQRRTRPYEPPELDRSTKAQMRLSGVRSKFVKAPAPASRLPSGDGRASELSGGVADGLVEDRQAERELVLGGGQWRGDPEDAAHAGQLHDVHVQDQFEAGQQAPSPDVADDLVPVRDLFEAMPQEAA